jgi:CBS domain-containing protein
MGKSISELMTENPRTVRADQTVVEAAQIMRDDDVGLVPIIDGDRLVGTVTDRDITVRVVAHERDPRSTTAREVASTDVVTVDPQQELDEALRLMAQHQVRRLPVVEEDGRLVGIVAQADVARHGDDRQTGQVVEQISQQRVQSWHGEPQMGFAVQTQRESCALSMARSGLWPQTRPATPAPPARQRGENSPGPPFRSKSVSGVSRARGRTGFSIGGEPQCQDASQRM